MVASALIGAGASLLGGLLGRKKTVSAETNSRQAILGQAAGARQASDRYGFNALTLLGASSAVGPSQSANYLGSAIADAGMILADGLAQRKQEASRSSQLQQENDLLKQRLQQQTLRPKFAGIYAQRQVTPPLRQALGRSDARSDNKSAVLAGGRADGANHSAPSSSASLSGLRPLPTTLPVDPRREVENKKLEPHAGFMVIDNPYLPRTYIPTLDGDEALDITQWPTAAAALYASGSYALGKKMREWSDGAKKRGTPVLKVGGKRFQQISRKDIEHKRMLQRPAKPGWMQEAYGTGFVR